MKNIQTFWQENKVNVIGWVVVLAVVLGIGAFAVSSQQQMKSARDEVLQLRTEDKFKGNPNASVVIYEYADLQCPACASWQTEIAQVIAQRGNDVKIVFRHFPLSIHKHAVVAGIAAEAAHRQGKFWEMHDILFATQTEWSGLTDPSDKFLEYAEEIGLDMDKFKTDLQDDALRQIVINDAKGGERIGVDATPTFFIGTEDIVTNTGAADLIKAIDAKLKK